MPIVFKDENGKKITIKGSGGSGVQNAVKYLDSKKDKEKDWWQLKEGAISEGKNGCINDLNKSIPAFIKQSQAQISKNVAGIAEADVDPVYGPAVIAALQQMNSTLKLLNAVLGDMQIYFNISKPDNMYFMNDDKTIGSAESSEDVSDEEFDMNDENSADN